MSGARQASLLEAASFLPLEVQSALIGDPTGTVCQNLPSRQVALLWCDIAGFSKFTNRILAPGEAGAEGLFAALDIHYRDLLSRITAAGGEPVAFVGDGLMCVWPLPEGGTPADALLPAIATAHDLAEIRAASAHSFDLNLHVVLGDVQTVELGGHHGRWLLGTLGTALKALEEIASIRSPNRVFLSAEAAHACGDALETAVEPGAQALRSLTRPVVENTATRTGQPDLPDGAWDAVQSRMPRPVSRWIDTIGLRWLPELRPTTAMTIALPGFDQAASDSAPHLNRIVTIMQDAVHARDGYVDSVVLDEKGASVLVLFGAPPDAHSDDPQRAVAAAMQISSDLHHVGVRSNIGVATGRAFSSILGNAARRAYLVLGDVVTRSSRLSAIGTGDIMVDDTTMAATALDVAYDDIGKPRGMGGGRRAWRAAGLAAREVPVAGRAVELTALRAMWTRACAEAPGERVMIIEGEPGAGKSFLIRTLQGLVERADGHFVQCAAASIESDVPFGGVRRMLMEVLGVSATMTSEERRQRLRDAAPEPSWAMLPLIEAVLREDFEETEQTQELSGAARAAATEDLTVELLKAAWRGRSICLCADDAQWLDDASRALLLRLAASMPTLALVIATHPVEDEDWRAQLEAAGTMMTLTPFTGADVEEVFRQHLSFSRADPEILELVTQTTRGLPFFGVEMVRSLIEDGMAVVEDGVLKVAPLSPDQIFVPPDTVYGMVLHRVDHLDPSEQLTLRAASVAGMFFATPELHAIHPLDPPPDELAGHLATLVRAGFISPDIRGSMPGFRFVHQFVRDIAYAQLPAPDRAALHLAAAQWIDTETGDDRPGWLLDLAYHWAEAGETDAAIKGYLDESLRIFSQGFAVNSVRVGFRAIRLTDVDIPGPGEEMQAAIGGAMAEIDRLMDGRDPMELLADMRPPSEETVQKLTALLSTAPFAFQSNQFEIFAWAAATAMRLTLEAGGGPCQAFSMYSIVQAALTGNRARGAAWSTAALAVDDAMGRNELPAVGFIDAWFHCHWRAPLTEGIALTQAAAEQAKLNGDGQFFSYNAAGEVVLRSAAGHRLQDVVQAGHRTLADPLHRNARLHVVIEMQSARALMGQTDSLTSMSGDGVDEAQHMAWVLDTEFVNQIGYYLATRVRLHRFAGDWQTAIAIGTKAEEIRPAISGQVAEVDLVFHRLLARYGQINGAAIPEADVAAMDADLSDLRHWASLHPGNFSLKAEIASAVHGAIGDGLNGAASAMAAKLDALAEAGADSLQDLALAREYATRLSPSGERCAAAARAYRDWGAEAVAQRLEDEFAEI